MLQHIQKTQSEQKALFHHWESKFMLCLRFFRDSDSKILEVWRNQGETYRKRTATSISSPYSAKAKTIPRCGSMSKVSSLPNQALFYGTPTCLMHLPAVWSTLAKGMLEVFGNLTSLCLCDFWSWKHQHSTAPTAAVAIASITLITCYIVISYNF